MIIRKNLKILKGYYGIVYDIVYKIYAVKRLNVLRHINRDMRYYVFVCIKYKNLQTF